MKRKTYLMLIVALITTKLISQTVIAQYDFSGNADDNTGNGNDGVVHEASLTEDRFGNINSAYQFNGYSSYISISNYSNFNFGLDDFAVSFWMESSSNNPKGTMFQKGSKFSSQAPQFWVRTNDNINNNKIAFLTSDANPPSPYAGSDTVTILDDEWHHVLVQRDEKFLQIHIDCQLVATNYDIYRNVSDNVGVIIGAQNPHPGSSSISNYFQGSLDDFRVYHEALVSSEIQSLCNDQVSNIDKKNTMNSFTQVYPNPTTGEINIQAKQFTLVEIYNLSGTLIMSTDKKEINLSQKDKGLYFIKVVTKNGTQTKKLLLQ